MAITFPASPSNGDTFVANSITYTYNASATIWTQAAATPAFNPASLVADMLPDTDSSRSLGSSTKKWKNLHA